MIEEAIGIDPNSWTFVLFVVFTCELPVAGRYQVSIEGIKGPAQGKVQIFVDEAPVGDAVDLYNTKRERTGTIPMAMLDLVEGQNHIMFKLVGKNEKSAGLNFDLTNIICGRISQ